MQIDWFTVIAQIVNFIILVVLLKYLLYDRVVDALNKREEIISTKLKEADKKNEEAEEKRKEFEKKKNEIEKDKESTLEKAKEEAEKKRKQIEKEAKEKIGQKRKEWEKQLENKKDDFLEDVRELISKEAFLISSKALKEIADENLETKIIEKFSETLADLSKDEEQEIKDSLKEADKNMTVKTTFELSKSSKDELGTILTEKFYKTTDIDYEVDEKIICGIELNIKNKKLNWNFNDFLNELDDKFQEILSEISDSTDEKEKKINEEK
jgi:F-type H+-transporting ATPase subunit b